MKKCECSTYYIFTGQPLCLHQLFQSGLIKAITREVKSKGAEFQIYAEPVTKYDRGRRKGQWNLTGRRSKIHDRDNVLLAIELAEKYKVQRIRL